MVYLKNKTVISLIYNILILKNIKPIMEYIKNICTDVLKCKNELDKSTKCFYDSCTYIFNNINQPFDSNIIVHTYFLLTNELLNEEIIDRVMKLYYRNIDTAPHSLAALLHLCIVNNISKNNVEFAFLISNYIMLKKDRWLLMPYEYCHNDYREAIVNNDLSGLIRIFYDIELVKKEKVPCLLSRDEVIKKIKSLKEELVSSYCVDKLYLFGSFAKGNNTEKSDLDFVVIFNESLINKEKNDMIKKVKEYLKNEFDCDVDLLDFSYALYAFDKSQMEYLITLI